MNNTYIYALIDPRTMDVRYVGKSNNPYRRYNRHLFESDATHKERWILSLRSDGFVPIMQIIEVCDKNVWQDRERDWIAFYRKIGCDLTNTTDGGDHPSMKGKHHSEETKRKMSDTQKRLGYKTPDNRGRHCSEETRKKISEHHRMKGKHHSEEWKMRVSKVLKGRVHSEETRKKISESNIGRVFSEEHKRKLSEARKGKAPWSKGKKFSEEYRKKLSEAQKGKHSGFTLGRRTSKIRNSKIEDSVVLI